MNRLIKTRSQHFVSSPRKTALPARHKLTRHSSKRRRVGSSALAISQSAARDSNDDDDDDDNDDEYSDPDAGPSRTRFPVLSSEAGLQAVNRSRSSGHRHQRRRSCEDGARDDLHAWRARIVNENLSAEDDENDDEGSSPKKRKRGSRDHDLISVTSGSWVETDDEEELPEYIAESDQHLLDEAPAHALHRLRKAELVRLWKVAGMWPTEPNGDGGDDNMAEEDEDDTLSKKDLVKGLVVARKQSSAAHLADPFGSPVAPAKQVLGTGFTLNPLRSASSSNPPTTPTSSSDQGGAHGGHRLRRREADATPRAAPRTRAARLRKSERSLPRPAQRRTNGQHAGNSRTTRAGKENVFRVSSRSMDQGERRARFVDEVKSPENATRPHGRRSSTLSSVYTTTDVSPSETQGSGPQKTVRKVPKNPRLFTARNRSRQVGKTKKRFAGIPLGTEVIVVSSSDDESGGEDGVDPAPLVQRLRPRTRSSLASQAVESSDAEADGEEDSDGDAPPSVDSPVLRRLSRSRASIGDSSTATATAISSSRIVRRTSKSLPDRGAKRKALEALKGGESEEDAMEVELSSGADEDQTMGEDGGQEEPRARPNTRSQGRGVTGESPLDHEMVQDEDEQGPDEGDTRFTRSGKAFGLWQSRKSRLRQEALDDPDMDVDEDTDDEEGDSFHVDMDLAEATLSSLVRLLRDELVAMCEARGIQVGGTKPQLARALLEWRDEQTGDAKSMPSSQETARPRSPSRTGKVIHAVGSHKHVSGKTTPVLLRDHVHAVDPATPPISDESKKDESLNLDLSELGLEDSIIKPSQLQKLDKIGSGGFKDVYVGKLRGRKVAISEFREHLSEMDIRELKLLAEFSHPNIVKFRGICIPEDNSQIPCMLVSELCENGDLFDYIRNVARPSLKRLLTLMLDIARGLEYLHTRKPAIIHRDCKSSNILINRAGHAKVGDFGLARVKKSTRSLIRSLVGTVNWQAPELWHPAPRYDFKVDVFSAGVVYWEMMSGWGWVGEKKYPWEGHNEHYIYDAVGSKHRRPSVAGLRKQWGAEPVNLMEKMWHQDPAERPTMSEVVVDLEAMLAECR